MRKYRLFPIKDVLNFERGQRFKSEDHLMGCTPYVSSTKTNNGISAYINPDGHKIYKNCLTFSNSGSVAYCFYHPYEFIASDHVTVLSIKDLSVELNIYIALYLKPILEALRHRYNFGREISNARLKKEYIKLPINAANFPDWDAMGDYIKQISKKVIFDNLSIEVSSTPCDKQFSLSDRKWEYFILTDLFPYLKRGSEQINETDEGEIPLISSGYKRNGFAKFINGGKNLFNKNSITIANNGSIGSSFYQSRDFYATADVSVIRNKHLNIFVGLFIATIIEKEKYKYNYGLKWSNKRMKQSKIKLPIDKYGNPDWQFMEDYIKSLPYSSSLEPV